MPRESAKSNTRETHEQKEQELLGRLEQKVEAVKALKSMMDRMVFNMTQEELANKLHDFFDRVKAQYPHLSEKLKRLTSLQQAMSGISTDLEDIYRTHGEEKIEDLMTMAALRGLSKMKVRDVGIVTQINDLEQERMDHIDEIESLEKDQDLRFLNSLQYGIDHMLRKFHQILQLKNDPEGLNKYCAKLLGVPADQYEKFEKGIEDMEFSPQCITVFMAPEVYEKFVGSTTSGIHLGGSPINIVKESGNEMDVVETMDHETIHAFVDGFLPPITSRTKYETDYWVNNLRLRVETLDRLLKEGHQVGESPKLDIEIPYFGTIANFIDSLHEEMVADMDRIEQLNVFVDSSKETLLKAFTTAKSRSYEVMLALQELKKTAVHPLLKQKLQSVFNDIALRLQKAAYQMSQALTIGSELGSDLDVEALLVLLKPSQYHHLQRYLKYLHGKKAYEDTEDRLSELYDLTANTTRLSA